jgi:HK97 family phage major capsid protein
MADSPQEKRGAPDQHRSETLVLNAGEPLKALGDANNDPNHVRVGAYAVRFSGPDEKDLTGEYFTKTTNFGKHDGNGADILFNHGEPIGDKSIFKKIADIAFESAKAVKDDIGIFVETVLDLADEYQKAIFDLIQAGKLAWSTGSASHVVKKAEDGQILRWPIVEVSFTPVPAEPRLPKIVSLKSVEMDDATKESLQEAFTPKPPEPTPPPPVVDKTKSAKTTPPPNTMADKEPEKKNGNADDNEPKFDRAAEIKKTRDAELGRQREIKSLGKPFETKGGAEFIEKAIEEGTSVEDFKKHTLPVLQKFNADEPARVQPDEAREGKYEDRQARKSIGQTLVESDAYKAMLKTTGSDRKASIWLPEVKATMLTSTGPFTSYERPPGPVMLEQQRLTVRDLLAQGSTTMNSIRYMKEDTYTNAATTVAEEGLKPEATFDLSEVDAPIRKVAVTGRVSDEVFSDFPALQSYVDQRLRFMLKEREEAQLLNGNASGTNLDGLTHVSGTQTQAAGATKLEGVLAAMTKVRATGHFEPDGIVLHPTDYQTLRLSKDANNQYYGGGAFFGPYGQGMVQTQPPIWGLNVVVTTAMAQGTGLVGAFRLGAMIFDRAGVSVETTNSDASDFVYNRIAIRVEERLALVVWRPLAFCLVTGL